MKYIILILVYITSTFSLKAQFSDAPITPTDGNIGITIIHQDGSSTAVEPIKYYKTKTGAGAFMAGLTYGISKVKNKNYYKSPTSPNIVNPGDKFIFSFGEIAPEYIATLYMFAPSYTIRNFSLVEFEKKKDRRELTTAEGNIWGGVDSGSKESEGVKFSVRIIEPNVYEATVTEAIPGEYGFIFTDNGIGAYQSIFDFSIPKNKK